MRTQAQGRPAPGVPEALPSGETPRWRRPAGAVGRWWLGPLPRARVARLRTVVYLFIFVDVLATTSWVADHADVSGQLYQPVLVARVLSLPVPGPGLVRTVEIALLAAAAVAATGRLPRLAGATVFALYFEWMVIAFSYGKVDHDRFAFLVALAVLPTVGRVVRGDRCADEAAGWALRAVQVAVVATYLLAAVAKFRFGGLAWLNSATLAWAVVRRGTFVADPLAQVPWVLQIAQWGIVAFELASPLMLVRGRIGRAMLGTAIAFHVVTYATITIIFLPHMICLLAFIPLERLRRGGSGEAGHAGERRSLATPAAEGGRRGWRPRRAKPAQRVFSAQAGPAPPVGRSTSKLVGEPLVRRRLSLERQPAQQRRDEELQGEHDDDGREIETHAPHGDGRDGSTDRPQDRFGDGVEERENRGHGTTRSDREPTHQDPPEDDEEVDRRQCAQDRRHHRC